MAQFSLLAFGQQQLGLRTGAALLGAMICLSSAAAEGQALKKPSLVTGDDPQRFMLIEVEGEYLRLDRRLGDISTCTKLNDVWRCTPAPDAELAYLSEIERLSAEVTELKARLAAIDSSGLGKDKQNGGSASPLLSQPEGGSPRVEAPRSETQQAPRLSEKDEKELEEVLGITEMAMRRFFGLMRDLQKDFEGSSQP